MKVLYENTGGEIRVWRFYSYGGEAEVPDCIEGCPVTELAPYAFSAHMEEEKLETGLKEGRFLLADTGEESAVNRVPPGQKETEDTLSMLPLALKGMELRKLNLPRTLKKIGAYAFYNCNALEKLSFFGGLKDLGAGLFTGCHHLKELHVTLERGESSCLQEILMEVPEKLSVTLHGNEEARLIFPEFYEEGVENTPARILMTKMHGSGMNYRNCFYQKVFDFQAYDQCFYRARAEEDFATVFGMAVGRLLYPWELGADKKAAYEDYICNHLEEAARKAVGEREKKLLIYLTETFVLPHSNGRDMLKGMIDLATSEGYTEGAAWLLDVLHRTFQTGAKVFEL